MRSFTRADRKQHRQKALLTHPKPLNPRLWPLGVRKCSNVGIKNRRADWCGYYAAGRLPRWGDTVSGAVATLASLEENLPLKSEHFLLKYGAQCTILHWIRPGYSLMATTANSNDMKQNNAAEGLKDVSVYELETSSRSH